jgi:hypothetical protein
LIDLKLDSERRPRLELAQVDFALCAENIRLMALFDDIQDGRISKIEVRAGVPRRVVFEERIANFGSEPSRPSQ